MTDMVFCGDCGTEIPASARFCPSCGAQQEPAPTAVMPPDAPPAPPSAPAPAAAPTVVPGPVPPETEPPERQPLWESGRGAPAVPHDDPSGPPPSSPAGGAGPAGAEHASLGGEHAPSGGEHAAPGGEHAAPGGEHAAPGAHPRGADRVERVAPGAGELARELAERVRTPGVVAAATVGGIALLVCLAVGLVTAIASPDRTIIGYLHGEGGIVVEALRLAVGTTLASVQAFGEGSDVQLLPLVFGLSPFLGAMVGARIAAPSLTGMALREAVAWSAAGAVVFAIGMLILALVANGQQSELGFELDFTIGSVLFMSLLLAGSGAAFGALRAGRALAPDRPAPELPAKFTGPARTVATPLVGLAALLAVTTLVSFVHVEVQTIRGQEDAVTSVRSDVGAAIENVLFAPDFGIDTAGLALLAEFDDSVLPISDDEQSDFAEALDDEGKGRIFDLSGALPIYVFLPELLILLGAALVAALYAGFATARRAAAPTQLVAAGWGALTGIVWALALVILRAMAFAPGTIGESVFACTLLIGTIAGAAGGLLAVRPAGRGAPAPGPGPAHG